MTTQSLVTVKFPPNFLDVKLRGVEVLIQPLLDDHPDVFYRSNIRHFDGLILSLKIRFCWLDLESKYKILLA